MGEARAPYGEGDFGRGCLMALRLIERGVRMVQVYYGNGQPWDNHDDILIHRKLHCSTRQEAGISVSAPRALRKGFTNADSAQFAQ